MDNTNLVQPSQAPSDKKKILIVEDDFFIRDLYELQARKAGYDVVIAADGAEAIEKARKEIPDILLIDLMLPKMDGLTVMKTVKADSRFSNTPCVIVTNLEDATKEQEAKSAGAAGYLLKIQNTPEMVIQSLATYIH
ncbi:response regulator [Candidatus Daviesbacteria bacterium]|nr:response regulator [Candidatus Daviesbacteria bacterium]